MFQDIMRLVKPALLLLVVMTALTGGLYPLAVTGLAQALVPTQANGSLIVKNGAALGSTLIGQPFTDPGHFWSRPSATAPYPYNAASSSGSNLGPTNPALLDAVKDRAATLRETAADPNAPVPVDLVTASGSGLDPHISPAAALYQVHRVAKARGLSEHSVRDLVLARVEDRQWGVLGEPRVNVLLLNLALQDLAKPAKAN